MGRGVSSGGGQSSLGYLFGDGEAPKPTTKKVEAPQNQGPTTSDPQKPTATAPAPNVNKQIPAGIQARNSNNYFRADGQNTGNFLTFDTMLLTLLFLSPPSVLAASSSSTSNFQEWVGGGVGGMRTEPSCSELILLHSSSSSVAYASCVANSVTCYSLLLASSLGDIVLSIKCLNLVSFQDRPSTKVHAAPGGGSSLGYLFGDGKN
ncbi:Protein SPIRAL1-like 1 [Capsicum annuum]|nr:Protein SPIRAL1-like 1 [Capsicum annuum]